MREGEGNEEERGVREQERKRRGRKKSRRVGERKIKIKHLCNDNCVVYIYTYHM